MTVCSWEKVPCPLCRSRRETVLHVQPAADGGQPYRVVRCQDCGVGYLNPRPDVASIAQFYPDEYAEYHAGHEAVPHARSGLRGYLKRLVLRHDYDYPEPVRHWAERLLALLARPFFGPSAESFQAIPYRGAGRLLDVGCGSGWYAARMKALGWDVVGLDFSAFAASQATQRYGIPTLVGSLPHPDIAPESFDTVTMGMMLEHVHDPHATIAAAARVLRPGGQLAIAVPNLDSWSRRRFGPDWWGWQLPVHLTHFTPASLRRLVEAHGLSVRVCETVVRPGWLARSFRTSQEHGSETSRTWLARLARWKPVRSLLGHWSAWRGEAESLLLVAERTTVARPALAA